MLSAKRNDELLVCLLLARLVEHAHVSLAPVERLGGFTETARETVVDQSNFEDTLERIEDGHAARAASGGDFDLAGVDIGRGGGGIFYIRLRGVSEMPDQYDSVCSVAQYEAGGRQFAVWRAWRSSRRAMLDNSSPILTKVRHDEISCP